jgi:hypothetical protein
MNVYKPDAVRNGVFCEVGISTLELLRGAQCIFLPFIKAVACDAPV